VSPFTKHINMLKKNLLDCKRLKIFTSQMQCIDLI
jgi:hypothetical protein